MKSGIIANILDYDLTRHKLNNETNRIETEIDQNGKAVSLQSFAQWNFRASEKITINTGIHSIVLTDNRTYSIEPRASIKYEITPKQSISLGYGLHGQLQPIGVYFAQIQNQDGVVQPNRNLEFTKAHHFVIG